MSLTKRPTEVSIFSSTGSLVEAAFGRDAPVIAIVSKGAISGGAPSVKVTKSGSL
jgi:hypothetical protein